MALAAVPNGRRHGIASAHFICPSKPSDVARNFPRAAHDVEWVCPPGTTLWPRCRHVLDRSARVQGPMRPTVTPQSTPCRFSFTLSQTRTISAKRAEVHQNLSRRPSPHGTATRRWPVKCRRGHTVCRPVVSEPQTTAFEDERRARLRAL